MEGIEKSSTFSWEEPVVRIMLDSKHPCHYGAIDRYEGYPYKLYLVTVYDAENNILRQKLMNAGEIWTLYQERLMLPRPRPEPTILVREEDLQNMFWFFALGVLCQLAMSAICS